MPIKGNNALEEERVKACINSGMVIETFLRCQAPEPSDRTVFLFSAVRVNHQARIGGIEAGPPSLLILSEIIDSPKRWQPSTPTPIDELHEMGLSEATLARHPVCNTPCIRGPHRLACVWL